MPATKRKATPFDSSNFYFSAAASLAAAQQVYPGLAKTIAADRSATSLYTPNDHDGQDWAGKDFLSESERADAEDGIDGHLTIKLGAKEVVMTVQERFRREKYARYRQVTVTDKNVGTGQEGDFHKLKADLYVYGYLGEDGDFIEAICVNVKRWKRAYEKGWITHDDRRWYARKKQAILAFNFSTLERAGAVVWHVRNGQQLVGTPS